MEITLILTASVGASNVDNFTLGMELAALAAIFSVIVLTALALVIKVSSAAYSKLSRVRRGVEAPPATRAEEVKEVSADESLEHVAAATLAIHKYLSEKSLHRVAGPPSTRANYWIQSWRVESCVNLNDIELAITSSRNRRLGRFI